MGKKTHVAIHCDTGYEIEVGGTNHLQAVRAFKDAYLQDEIKRGKEHLDGLFAIYECDDGRFVKTAGKPEGHITIKAEVPLGKLKYTLKARTYMLEDHMVSDFTDQQMYGV